MPGSAKGVYKATSGVFQGALKSEMAALKCMSPLKNPRPWGRQWHQQSLMSFNNQPWKFGWPAAALNDVLSTQIAPKYFQST
ncbi:hypothetical protein GOBAR_DD35941 [Gossypium barbadense]|nr:hypothetical protein GOBAR_DD35941 [Gossypium barbadense]